MPVSLLQSGSFPDPNATQVPISLMVHQQQLRFSTPGRGTLDISRDIDEVIRDSCIRQGICQIFIHHTSASLILCENADPTVRTDLETFMKKNRTRR